MSIFASHFCSLFALLLLLVGSACEPADRPEGHPKQALPSAQMQQPASRQLRQVEVAYVDFSISTFVAISCRGFEEQFSDGTYHLFLTDNARLARLLQYLEAAPADTRGLKQDVRANAVLLYRDNSRDTLCIDQFTTHFRGRVITTTKPLRRLLGLPEE